MDKCKRGLESFAFMREVKLLPVNLIFDICTESHMVSSMT